MGVRIGSQFTGTPLNVLPASAVETLIFTTGPLVIVSDEAMVQIVWSLVITVGTGTTALQIPLYRGPSLAYPGVPGGDFGVNVTAGTQVVIGGTWIDFPGGGSIQYSLSVVQTGASGAGVIADGGLLVLML